MPVLALVGSIAVASPTGAPPIAASASQWSRLVTEICGPATLFERAHAMGTRAAAQAVAADIRASTARRITKIEGLSVRAPQQARRWLQLERRLASRFASSYVGIADVIYEVDRTAEMPARVQRLLHAPDRLSERAAVLERRLRVPDCTGGENTRSSSNIGVGP